MSEKTHPSNSLIQETSPYLRQHAHNPVQWYPWGKEALGRAEGENKPIFLSIGYSACHWCHVMERESFEDEEIAEFLNEHFISIKVDREERPDLDHIYMNIVQLMTGHGGWPMTVFLSPDQKPIFAGTYFPPRDSRGMPGFDRIIREILRIFNENPPQLKAQTDNILSVLKQLSEVQSDQQCTNLHQSLEECGNELLLQFDPVHGGFGGAPKFPQTMALQFLLVTHQRTQKPRYLEPVLFTLDKMGKSGMYDHLMGGFARYSVDERWAVPHFEKMLYDNALLSSLYADGFKISKSEFLKEICLGIAEFVAQDMTHNHGGFYSSMDADSEGEEGKFAVWTYDEWMSVLGSEMGSLAANYFGVDQAGNFEGGSTVLFLNQSAKSIAQRENKPVEEIQQIIDESKKKLIAARQERVPPDTDRKILTSWNALMIRGLVKCFEISAEEVHLGQAKNAANFLLQTMSQPQKPSRLWATTIDDEPGKLEAYLDDYAFLTAALIDLFLHTSETRYLVSAMQFHQAILDHFEDQDGVGFFFTADDHEALIDRPKSLYDSSVPSGISVVLENALRFSSLAPSKFPFSSMERHYKPLLEMAISKPLALSNTLCVGDLFSRPSRQIVVIEGEDSAQFEEIKNYLNLQYLPGHLVLYTPNSVFSGEDPSCELLQGKELVDGKTSVYLCENQTCSLPIHTLEDLEKALEE